MYKIKLSELNKPDKSGWCPIHYFAANGNDNLIKQFVQNGADVNRIIITTEPKMAVTPMILAIRGGYTSTVTLLAELGAEINLPCEGITPILYAIQHKQKAIEITKALVEQKAEVSDLKQIIEKHGSEVLLKLGVQETVIKELVEIINYQHLAEDLSFVEDYLLPAADCEKPIEESKDANTEEPQLGGVVEQEIGDQ
jgi:ankyrin repeat protein